MTQVMRFGILATIPAVHLEMGLKICARIGRVALGGNSRKVALIAFAAATISVCASAAPADYDGKWYLSGDCSALTVPPFDPAFHYEWLTTIQGGAFSELKIGANVRGVRT